ncbi:hypothetical protein SESBI_20430 [Sesbania bispinosa]|nr:hypothetical protein SESBI_20430 [Sesbania bispinosa]
MRAGRKLEHAKKLKVEQDQLQSQVEKLKRVEEEEWMGATSRIPAKQEKGMDKNMTRYQVRMMEDLTDLTLENEELKKEIKQMRAEMDKMSESMRIMEKQNAEGTSTVKQMTQMFEAMQKSAEKRSMVDTTETAATPDYPPGFTQGLMPVTVHLNKPVQQVDPPEVQWPLYGLPPNYTPPIVNNASDQTAKPQGSDAKVADSQITPPQVEEEEQCMRRRVEEVKTPLGDAAVRTTNRPIPITIQVPTSFPYKDNKAVPWRYDVEVLVGDRQVGETNVDTPNVTNIAGVGGMTRSGRIYTPDEFRTTQSSEVIKEKERKGDDQSEGNH